MKLGTMATIGANGPDNLMHILLDNGVHDSTGGQSTVSASVDFPALALAAKYRSAYRCDSVSGFEIAFNETASRPGPHFIHVGIAVGSMSNLGRPTVRPFEVADRFRSFLAQPQP